MSIWTPRKTNHPDRKFEDFLIDDRKIYQLVKEGEEEVDGEKVAIPFYKVVDHKIDLIEYINSFKDECGVKNVLKKFMMTGDESLFARNQVIENVDATEIPNMSPEELMKTLPEDLTKGVDWQTFVQSLTPEQLNAYIDSVVAAKVAEGGNNDGNEE